MGRGAPAVLLQELPDVLLKKTAPPSDDTVASLRAALVALDAGDDALAITALVDVWRARRSPAIAELVELLDLRQPKRAFDGLIATKADTTCNRLAAANPHDPRVSGVLLEVLEHPKFLTDAEFWGLVAAQAKHAADPRILVSFPKLRSIVYARVSPAQLRNKLVRRLDAIVAEVRAPRDPTPEEAALERELASRLRGAKSRRDSEAAILREIYEDPMADGPRLVYADLLSERGDPRGELITLQFARRAGTADASQKARERWLMKKHMKEWLGGLAPAVSNIQSYSQTTFERGFVAIADIYNSAEKKLPLTWSEPGWATVEELRGPFHHLVFEKAPLRGLRRIADVENDATLMFARMPEKFRCLEDLGLWQPELLGTRARLAIDACVALPALRSLAVTFWNPLGLDDLDALLADIAWLTREAAIARRLQRLVISGGRYGGDPGAKPLLFDEVLRQLPATISQIPEIAILAPWNTWPQPAPVEFRRGPDGKYARVS